MSEDMQTRIQRMFRGDVIFAWGFVAVLWAVIAFVFFDMSALLGGGTVQTALLISGALVLLFNTAAIFAMVRHYSHEKEIIYTIDLRHLDAMRAAKNK